MNGKLFFSCAFLSILLCYSLVVSVDAASMWNRTYGGADFDSAVTVVETMDGGYAIAGNTDSFGAGSRNAWLIKTDAFGYLSWNRTYGGTEADWARSMIATPDGGYALAGATLSFSAERYDFWLVKIDAVGNMEWNRTYGENGVPEEAESLIATPDGGYAIVGFSNFEFVWFVKTDAFGNMEWNKLYGGLKGNKANVIIATPDGGYALAGSDWLIKTDAFGNLLWNITCGKEWTTEDGTVEYYGTDTVVATPDGGYALAGSRGNHSIMPFSTGNTKWDGYREGNRIYGEYSARSLAESSDEVRLTADEIPFYSQGLWLVKVGELGNVQWNRTYLETANEGASSVITTSDGGYALAGGAVLVKTDEFGNLQWNRTYGSQIYASAYSLVSTSDGGYALAGVALISSEPNNYDFWLAKTDELGVVPEYSSWLVPALVLTATAFLIIKAERKRRRDLEKN